MRAKLEIAAGIAVIDAKGPSSFLFKALAMVVRVVIPRLLCNALLGVSLLSAVLSTCDAEERPMDQVVLQRIERQLESDIRLRNADLDIQVVAGQVTLQGQLPSFVESNRVERICRLIDGVTKVTNRITIAPVPDSELDLCHAVQERLSAEPTLRNCQIKVEADGTIVTLRGGVDSLFARRWAQRSAEQVRGVSRVRNELSLDPIEKPTLSAPDEQLEQSIRETLEKDARSLVTPIQITVRDGVVTLEGEVSNPSRRRFYRYLVERIRGVRAVQNRLEVRSGVGRDVEPPTLEEAAWDVQLALDAAQLATAELSAKLADDKIAITGNADSLLQKQQVVRLANAFASGYPVIDAMTVIPIDQSAEQLQADLVRLFRSDVLLGDAPIQVAVEQQDATLSGTVERFADKLRAERLASRVAGIRKINNQLIVEWMATISDQGLKTRIEERLQRNRLTAGAADLVEVIVQRGHVILKGKVPGVEARREIGSVVLRTDGIRSVDNEIKVEPADQ